VQVEGKEGSGLYVCKQGSGVHVGQTYHLSSPATYSATAIWPMYAPLTSPNVQVGVRGREVIMDRMSAMEGNAWAEFVRHADAAGDRLPPLGSPVQQVRATGLQGQLEWFLGRERGAFRPQSPGPAGLWARVGKQQQKCKNAGAAVGLQGMRVGSASSHGRNDQRAHGTSRYMPNGSCLEGTSIGHAMIWPEHVLSAAAQAAHLSKPFMPAQARVPVALWPAMTTPHTLGTAHANRLGAPSHGEHDRDRG